MKREDEIKDKLEEKKKERSEEASCWIQALEWVLEDDKKLAEKTSLSQNKWSKMPPPHSPEQRLVVPLPPIKRRHSQ